MEMKKRENQQWKDRHVSTFDITVFYHGFTQSGTAALSAGLPL
jgi:hypothetical protein